jgi:hypothetical protein
LRSRIASCMCSSQSITKHLCSGLLCADDEPAAASGPGNSREGPRQYRCATPIASSGRMECTYRCCPDGRAVKALLACLLKTVCIVLS